MNEVINTGQIWYYVKNKSQYEILGLWSMKLGSGDWFPSVTYKSLDTHLVFTRDLKTFIRKFEFSKELR